MPDVTAYIAIIANVKAQEKYEKLISEFNRILDFQSRDHISEFAKVLWGKSSLSRAEAEELLGGLSRLYVRDEIQFEIYTQSDPRPPEKVVMRIAEILTKVDPKSIVTMTYFDDEPTFYGAISAFLQGGEITSFDDEEWVQDDERICWDHEVDDIIAEYGSEIKIRSWDSLHSEITEMLQSTIESIKELRDEAL